MASDEEHLKQSMKNSQMFYGEIFLRSMNQERPKEPLILLQPQCLIPFEMQRSAIYNFEKLIQKDKEMARDQYDTIFGAYIPDIEYQSGEAVEDLIN